MTFNTKQLALKVDLKDDATLSSYWPGDNKEVIDTLLHHQRPTSELFVYLWGQPGVGKTHLIQGACHQATSQNKEAVYFPLKSMRYRADIFMGLEQLSLVCLDDIEAIVGDLKWEEAIFHLYNRLRANGTPLLISAQNPPHQLKVNLADLSSRLAWGLTYHIKPLCDEQKLQALTLRAMNRGLELPRDVGRFLLARCERNMGELYSILDQLDRASLIAQRRLTIPFVKHVLSL